ncbi:hypothetical protein Tco_0001649 [Tanacetum coccineum]
MVYQLTKFHVQRVDMVINPPWNLPFLGAKGLTSPEQTATGKGISNPLMAVMVCQKPYGIQLTNVSSTERVNTPGSDENRLKLYDLILGDDASKQGRINDIIADEDITLIPKLIIKLLKILSATTAMNGVALDEEQLLFIAGGQDNTIDEDVDEQPVQDLAINVGNVFQADDCDAFDSDVDEAPTTQTMFMANLSSADPVYNEAGPSYDLDILSEVHNHDHYQDAVCKHHEEHEMHDDVQPNYVVDSHANYTSDSNMIPYEQYVKDNTVPVVQSNVSSVPNNAYMMIFNDMHKLHAQPVSVITRNTVVDNSLTVELATYKEQVELYERRARFELTEREQKIDEQLRIVITDRNTKEETLKKERHSVKMQLSSTINHNKLMVEEVTSLKNDFKQKENKYLEEFLDMKALKEKVKDKLYKQDQSLQTVHMLCKPKPYYNKQNKVDIGYNNPLCLTRAKQVQPAVYNGYEIIKNNHVPAIVHNTEDTLEIAEITRRKMNDKMKDPKCVTHKVKIAPPDYSKENYLATFTPQKQLTSSKYFGLKISSR